MNSSWDDFFSSLPSFPFWARLNEKVDEAYASGMCFPPKERMFAAFDVCPLEKLKVVIIGQDPYANPGQAMGLSFSVPPGTKLPPSLRNIHKEIESEGFGYMNDKDGDLTFWANQGVLLLNTYLSVEQGKPGSHAWKEYEEFLRAVMTFINGRKQDVVWMFWGSFAQKFERFANNSAHLKLFANHPSPLSANRGGWFGCNHFRLANAYLQSRGLSPIDWCNSPFRL
ncbi:MAG: uracil-DNA glycosylase [Bacilli bacterium]|nr:uracil-DNA glycosylase [Bacilli bacterium]